MHSGRNVWSGMHLIVILDSGPCSVPPSEQNLLFPECVIEIGGGLGWVPGNGNQSPSDVKYEYQVVLDSNNRLE